MQGMAYRHKEAYCLMLYTSDDGFEVELLWNSRDGVTPFCIQDRTGKISLTHGLWKADLCAPLHVPEVGHRVFIDADREKLRPIAVARAEEWLKQMACEATQAELTERLLDAWTEEGSPMVAEVTEEMRAAFLLRAADMGDLEVAFSQPGATDMPDGKEDRVFNESELGIAVLRYLLQRGEVPEGCESLDTQLHITGTTKEPRFRIKVRYLPEGCASASA